MKLHNAIGLATAVTLMTSPLEAREIEQTIDAAPAGEVRVSNVSGSVDIQGWSRNQVEVTGSLGDDVEEVDIRRSGDTVRVKVKIPEKGGRYNDSSAQLTIRVPESSSLDVATVSADIDVRGVVGGQELQAISGDIDTEAHTGDIDAETVSGDIDIQGDARTTRTDVTTVSGDIAATNIAGDVFAETVSGEVGVVGSVLNRVDVETVNGAVNYRAAMADGGRIDVETVNGRVGVDLVGDVSARIDIETFNGRINNCFGPKPERTSKYAPGWELSFTEGDGEGRIQINTLNGGVKICKDD